MTSNRQKFLTILSKWRVRFPKEEYDYGYRLRELLRNKNELEEIFPGTYGDNARKLEALTRLVNNAAKNKFQINADLGASGFKKQELRNLIEQQIELLKKTS